ncbi:helix-turn-helix transcriptional regulator [Lactiplantibacillus pentosus]|uniref:helix-turn-helix transcriptional regulator n=1 Tax=Lactiplantibacillus pentosus TaxID=1589 RepID=UPI00132FDD85|nr:helix-turn-helix transcriptional regulator [Lactiplantibacillus pentosus]MBQ0836066.1 helix-turn-helix transcriptional regulator [Lactiplantibacillus pentosus]
MVQLYVVGKNKIDVLLAWHGYTQKSLSSRVNIGPSYMSSILNGKKPVGKKTAKKIADKLGVEVADIFLLLVLTKVIQSQRRWPNE